MSIYQSLFRKTKTFPVLSDDVINNLTDRNNPTCVFYNMVGQDRAVSSILDLIYEALRKNTHLPKVGALLFHGPKSTGKTTFAKLIAKALNLPFIESDGNLIKNTDDIFAMLKGCADDHNLPVVQKADLNNQKYYRVPNTIFFIDEIQTLSSRVEQGLLKALESKDRVLTTRKSYVDCSQVLWIGATTERGDLFDAFESRFFKIGFLPYTTYEVVKILRINFPDWKEAECSLVAKYTGNIVRESIDFATVVDLNANRCKIGRLKAIENIRKQKDIHPIGLNNQQILILKALSTAERGLNYEQLARIASCKVQELKSYILPAIQPYTVWTGKNTYITRTGIRLLRGL